MQPPATAFGSRLPKAVGWLAVASLGLTTCASERAPSRAGVEALPRQEIQVARIAERTPLSHEAAIGISGMCRSGPDLWMVSDREGMLLRFREGSELAAVPIRVLEDGLDLEGVACADDVLYLSTESAASERAADVVLEARLEDGRATIVDSLTFAYPSGARGKDNQGLEGICRVDDQLLASGEIISKDSSGRRLAPLLVKPLGGGPTRLLHLALTSDTGKIAGLDCRRERDRVELFAIERHFEVARVAHYRIQDDDFAADAPVVEPITVIELAPILRDKENFEGIVVDEQGVVSLVNDNHYGRITGSTELTRLEGISELAATGARPDRRD